MRKETETPLNLEYSDARIVTESGNRVNLLSVFRSGGFSEIFSGQDSEGKYIILKAATDNFPVDSLRKEAETIQRLDHPNIVKISGMDSFVMHGKRYDCYVTDMRGLDETLDERDHEDINLEIIANVAEDIGSALDHVAKKGYTHNDVHETNIFLIEHKDEDGNIKFHAILFDFGTAELLADKITYSTEINGRVSTIAPERIVKRSSEVASDQYSLASVVFKMFTDEKLIDPEDYTDINEAIAHIAGSGGLKDYWFLRDDFEEQLETATADQLNNHHSDHLYVQKKSIKRQLLIDAARKKGVKEEKLEELANVLDKALSNNPGNRFPSCTDFAEALSACF